VFSSTLVIHHCHIAHIAQFTCHNVYNDSPNTDTIQYMVLFSHLTVQLPSVVLSQKHELDVCSPAPVFCIMMQFTTYLNGLLSLTNCAKHCSTTADVHWLTFCWLYALPPITLSIDSLIKLLTSSTTNCVSSPTSSSIFSIKEKQQASALFQRQAYYKTENEVIICLQNKNTENVQL